MSKDSFLDDDDDDDYDLCGMDPRRQQDDPHAAAISVGIVRDAIQCSMNKEGRDSERPRSWPCHENH
jgi:hypothetical protein